MGGVSVSKEEYMQACAADLYEFLVRSHAAHVKVKYGSALLCADEHVSVKRGFHGYRNFKTGETGNNIDYLMTYLGYGYQDAVLALIGESGSGREHVPAVNPSVPETREILLYLTSSLNNDIVKIEKVLPIDGQPRCLVTQK